MTYKKTTKKELNRCANILIRDKINRLESDLEFLGRDQLFVKDAFKLLLSMTWYLKECQIIAYDKKFRQLCSKYSVKYPGSGEQIR